MLRDNRLPVHLLPVCIGLFEADAIYPEMQAITHRCPLAHDLLERIIRTSKGMIRRVIITHHKEGIYYATIEMERDGSLIEIDARPSDSIVMALKFNSPIYITKKLFGNMVIPIGNEKKAMSTMDSRSRILPTP